jgi:flagellar biogenesis protein FliO
MRQDGNAKTTQIGGLAGWLLRRVRAGGRTRSRLELVERIALAPRQSLALVEAEGRRFLVATSPEGAPTFYALDERSNAVLLRPFADRPAAIARPSARVSW